MPEANARDRDAAKRISTLEWISGAIGVVVIVLLLGYLVREATLDPSPPLLTVHVDSVAKRGALHALHFRVMNRGRATAADVGVTGTLGDEEREATLDYVPGDSEAGGALFFEGDPRPGSVVLRISGYREP